MDDKIKENEQTVDEVAEFAAEEKAEGAQPVQSQQAEAQIARKIKKLEGQIEKDEDKRKKRLRTLGIVGAILVVICIVLVVLRWFIGGWWIDWETGRDSRNTETGESTETEETKQGEFVAPPHDDGAVKGTPHPDEALGWSALDIQEGYTVHVCGVLKANKDMSLPVYFTSDETNKVWVKLRIIDDFGKTVGETGLLYPGEYVELVQLEDGTVSGRVSLQVMGYEPDTYYSAGSVKLMTMLEVPAE